MDWLYWEREVDLTGYSENNLIMVFFEFPWSLFVSHLELLALVAVVQCPLFEVQWPLFAFLYFFFLNGSIMLSSPFTDLYVVFPPVVYIVGPASGWTVPSQNNYYIVIFRSVIYISGNLGRILTRK